MQVRNPLRGQLVRRNDMQNFIGLAPAKFKPGANIGLSKIKHKATALLKRVKIAARFIRGLRLRDQSNPAKPHQRLAQSMRKRRHIGPLPGRYNGKCAALTIPFAPARLRSFQPLKCDPRDLQHGTRLGGHQRFEVTAPKTQHFAIADRPHGGGAWLAGQHRHLAYGFPG